MDDVKDCPFTQFPVEIVRRILEIAALDNRRVACAIARTSSRSLRWITPILYHTIFIRHPSALLKLVDTLVHHKPRLCEQVRHIALEWHLRPDDLAKSDLSWNSPSELERLGFAGPRLLQFCTHLHSLAVDRWYPLSDQAFAYASNTLTELHILPITPRGGRFSATIFPTITHLCISMPFRSLDDHFYRSILHETFLPNLTHLACMACDPGDDPIALIRQILSSQFPLVIFVLTIISTRQRYSRPLSDCSPLESNLRGIRDSRLRVLRRQPPKSARKLALGIWERAACQDDNIWTRAETKPINLKR